MSRYVEVQCDGIVGPTHNYAGLSHGNVASQASALSTSNPKKAALEGLKKMEFVANLGIPQLMLPPPLRPNLGLLQQLGFTGSVQEMFDAAWESDPLALYAAWSASSMWAANMATVSPAPDTGDGKLHFTPANLASTLHRQQEAAWSYKVLSAVFGAHGVVHPPLPACLPLTDEGAANHMRFAAGHGSEGVEVFVYGRKVARPGDLQPVRYPARQTRESCEAIARSHGLLPERTVFVQQHPEAIDAGVFHNDVIAMSNETLLIYHETAFADERAFLAELREKIGSVPLQAIRIAESSLPLVAAVKSYFFNSQLLSLPGGGMAIIAPVECKETPAAYAVLEGLVADDAVPIRAAHYLDVRESMRNGGGPACLRLRVVLPESDVEHHPLRYSAKLAARLSDFITDAYPDHLTADSLRDASLAAHLAKTHAHMLEILQINTGL